MQLELSFERWETWKRAKEGAGRSVRMEGTVRILPEQSGRKSRICSWKASGVRVSLASFL